MKNVFADKTCKSRYFTFKVYSDNLARLRLTLDDLKTDLLECGGGFISPLHDKDDCKPHYHVISISENARNCFFLHDLVEKYESERFIGKVNSSSKDTFLLYLTHENDNNTKFTYSRTDVICVGVNYDDWLSDTESDNINRLSALSTFAEGFVSFSDFSKYVRYECPNLLPYLIRYAYFFNLIINSNKESFNNENL